MEQELITIFEDGEYREVSKDSLYVIAIIPPPPVVRHWTPLEFMELFSFEERVGMRQLARGDLMVDDWLDLLRASTYVTLDDQRTLAGLQYMVMKGCLTQDRANEILALKYA